MSQGGAVHGVQRRSQIHLAIIRLCCAVVHETIADVPGVLHLFLLPDDIKLPIDNNGAQAAFQ
jgi:hypothetical protein